MTHPCRKRGSALMLALITIVVLASLMMSFLFRIHLEADLALRERFGFKAEALARAGQEYAKWMLIKSSGIGNEPEDEMTEAFYVAAKNLQRGVALQGYRVEMDDGVVEISITPETSRRNVNRLSDPDWEQMLGNSGVPETYHPRLIAAFRDWTDADEATRLLGAEEDDRYYRDLDLPVKNGPVESLAELQMIRGFTRAVLYGGTLEEFYDEPDIRVSGIAGLLTVYGEQSINLNSASREVLMTLSGIREAQVDQIIEGRAGNDGEWGTEDDGYQTVLQGLAAGTLPGDLENLFNTRDLRWVRVVTIGEAGGIRKGQLCIYEFTGNELILLSSQARDL